MLIKRLWKVCPTSKNIINFRKKYDRLNIIVVIIMKQSFTKKNTYKLYREVGELLHPVISKRNISNYKIVLQEKLLPVRVFYPKKVSFLKKVIIFIPGIVDVTEAFYKYDDICREMALETDRMVIALDYEEDLTYLNLVKKCMEVITYLYERLEKEGVLEKNISLIGDSIGASIIGTINYRNVQDKKLKIAKNVLLYPVLSGEYFGESTFLSITKNEKYDLLVLRNLRKYYETYAKNDLDNEEVFLLKRKDFSNFPTTLLITGNLDCLKDEGEAFYQELKKGNVECEYFNLNFENHGFLKDIDMEMKKELYSRIKEFLDK